MGKKNKLNTNKFAIIGIDKWRTIGLLVKKKNKKYLDMFWLWNFVQHA